MTAPSGSIIASKPLRRAIIARSVQCRAIGKAGRVTPAAIRDAATCASSNDPATVCWAKISARAAACRTISAPRRSTAERSAASPSRIAAPSRHSIASRRIAMQAGCRLSVSAGRPQGFARDQARATATARSRTARSGFPAAAQVQERDWNARRHACDRNGSLPQSGTSGSAQAGQDARLTEPSAQAAASGPSRRSATLRNGDGASSRRAGSR